MAEAQNKAAQILNIEPEEIVEDQDWHFFDTLATFKSKLVKKVKSVESSKIR